MARTPLYEILVSGPEISTRSWSIRTRNGDRTAREIGASVLGISGTNKDVTEGVTAQGYAVVIKSKEIEES